jgi:hypothetical protein
MVTVWPRCGSHFAPTVALLNLIATEHPKSPEALVIVDEPFIAPSLRMVDEL